MDIKVLASGSSGNCYLISDGRTRILLDAGISISRIREGCGYRLSDILACLITHCHSDHTAGLRGLLKSAVDVYMPDGEIAVMGLTNAPGTHRLHSLRVTRSNDGAYRVYPYFKIGTFVVVPFQTEHDTPEPVGYLLFSDETKEKLLYFTDTYFLQPKFSGITHIIGECNYVRDQLWEKYESGDTPSIRAKRLFGTHMSLETFLNFLDALENKDTLEQIYICHMSNDHGDEARIVEAVRRKTGAEVYVC